MGVIPISLNYYSFVLVKMRYVSVALNPNSQLLLNRAPCPDLFTYAQQDHKLNETGIRF